MLYLKLLGLKAYLTLLIVAVALVGDYLVSHFRLLWHRALIDNATHAFIGGLSWSIVCLSFRHSSHNNICEIAVCTLVSSFIDLDHFVVAHSLSIQNATSLSHRPFLHCSTIPILLTVTLLVAAYKLHSYWLVRLSFIIITAFVSHHTRDAMRRGYWVYPFGSTQPISYITYIAITVAIPYIICAGLQYIDGGSYFNNTMSTFSLP